MPLAWLEQATNGLGIRCSIHTELQGHSEEVTSNVKLNSLYFWNELYGLVVGDSGYIAKTTDGGNTWKISDNGLPETKFTGRIGLSFSRSNPNVVYAYVDNHSPKREPKPGELDPYGRPIQVIPFGVQVYRSDDKGDNWRKVSTEDDKLERFAGTYGWVFGQISVDPNDENTVYILGVPLAKSTDGGKTFNIMRAEDKLSERTHGDINSRFITRRACSGCTRP